MSQPPSGSRLLVHVTLCSNSFTILPQALIDSCDEYNFLDRDFAVHSGFSLRPVETPVNVNALDGRLLARATEQTAPLTLVIFGNHKEPIGFKIISTPETPLVLGHP